MCVNVSNVYIYMCVFVSVHVRAFIHVFICSHPLTSACLSDPALEQRRGGGGGVLPKPGEAQRLSSLTFGCFQVRGKSPQVLIGPEPSQRTLSTQPEREAEGDDKTGKTPGATGSMQWICSCFLLNVLRSHLQVTVLLVIREHYKHITMSVQSL